MTELVLETKAIAAESGETLAVAQNFKITSAPQYEEAGEKLKGIKALSRKIDDTFDPHIKRAFEAHRSLVGEKKKHTDPLRTAEALLKTAMLGYQQAEEQKRREIEAKAQEAARKDRERLEAQAAKAAAKGKEERSAALQAAAAAVVAPMIAPTTPKVAGISMRTSYRAEVIDKMALVKAVAAGIVPLTAIDANMPFLNNQARAMKDELAYPGVKVVQETALASRTA
jgi:hypothetical protein